MDALRAFLADEGQSIAYRVHEQNLSGRLAFALERLRMAQDFPRYYVDTKYDLKQNGEVKTIKDGEAIVPIRPDVILHSRGEQGRDHLLAVEVKIRGNNPRSLPTERRRLQVLTSLPSDGIYPWEGSPHPEHVCGYVLGYFFILNPERRSYTLEEYRGGDGPVEAYSGSF